MSVSLVLDRSVLNVPDAPAAADGQSVDSPIAKLDREFTTADAERLLWRFGFGPRDADEPKRLAALGLDAAVTALTRPRGRANLVGKEPRTEDGPLAPLDSYGGELLQWLDRMVRSDQPHIERLALVLHDWFATSNASIGTNAAMLRQTNLFRSHGSGSFVDLLIEVTRDPAMLIFLNGIDNHKDQGNENFAREVMELFTLGADRGAYTETDVRELARALSGFVGEYDETHGGWGRTYYAADTHDTKSKTIFGQTGNYGWKDACHLVTEHPLHALFFVTKLWGYFIPNPPDDETRGALEQSYVASGHQIRPVIEAIAASPRLYDGARMVKPPAVFVAGLLRGLGRSIDTQAWEWLLRSAGQRLYEPPNVAGWKDDHWLDTSQLNGRFQAVVEALKYRTIAGEDFGSYSGDETSADAVEQARLVLGAPALSAETVVTLIQIAERGRAKSRDPGVLAQQQNILRHLIALSPDCQTS